MDILITYLDNECNISSLKQGKIMKKIFMALLCLCIISCSKETDRDKIGDAQICLDSVTSANPDYADTCAAKVESIQSASADGIRCSASFVKEGFTDATVLVNTFQTIQGGLSSSNLGSFLSLILFDGRNNLSTTTPTVATTYYSVAKTSSTYCASAQLKVGTLLTTFSFLGNALIKLGCDAGATCGTNFFSSFNGVSDALALATYLGNSANTAGVNQLYSDLGTLVINSYLISCVGTIVNQSLCDNVGNAVSQGGGTSNPQGVGKKFLSITTGISLP